jgi:hypothetical protein
MRTYLLGREAPPQGADRAFHEKERKIFFAPVRCEVYASLKQVLARMFPPGSSVCCFFAGAKLGQFRSGRLRILGCLTFEKAGRNGLSSRLLGFSASRLLLIIGVVVTMSMTVFPQGGLCPIVSWGVDDGFRTGQCCFPVAPNLPGLVIQTFAGRYGTFLNCQVEVDDPVQITLMGINPIGCPNAPAVPGEDLTATIAITAPFPAPTLACPAAYLRFSRTYYIQNPDGNGDLQVWRYLVNGNFMYTSGEVTRRIPDCAATFGDVWFKGILEFACRPGFGGVIGGQQGGGGGDGKAPDEYYLIALSHHEGCIDHQFVPINVRGIPGPSPLRHDDRSFHIVAPANFTFLSGIPLPGAIDIPFSVQDSVRSNISPNSPMCLSELAMDPVLGVSLVEVANLANCYCSIAQSPIWRHQNLLGALDPACAVFPIFQSVPSPIGPPTGFAQQYIGLWGPSTPWTFPGKTELHANIGLISYVDNCNPATTWQLTYGNTTYTDPVSDNPTIVTLFHDPLNVYSILTDFQDSWIQINPVLGTYSQAWGSQGRSEIVFQLAF